MFLKCKLSEQQSLCSFWCWSQGSIEHADLLSGWGLQETQHTGDCYPPWLGSHWDGRRKGEELEKREKQYSPRQLHFRRKCIFHSTYLLWRFNFNKQNIQYDHFIKCDTYSVVYNWGILTSQPKDVSREQKQLLSDRKEYKHLHSTLMAKCFGSDTNSVFYKRCCSSFLWFCFFFMFLWYIEEQL